MQLICCCAHVHVHHTYTFTLIYSTQSQVYSHKSHFLPFCQGSTAQGKIRSITQAHCHARKFSVMSNESSGLPPSFTPSLPPSFHADPTTAELTRSISASLRRDLLYDRQWIALQSHFLVSRINYALIFPADEQHMLILEAKGQR